MSQKFGAFKSASLKKQIIVTVSLFILLAVLVESIFAYASLSSAYQTAVGESEASLDDLIKNETKSMINILQVNYNSCKKANMPDSEAKTYAENIVRDARYDNGEGLGRGYFWADEASGKCAIHSNTSYEGLMRLNNKDQKGNYYIQNCIAAGNKPDDGFTDFWFTKPGKKGNFQKRAYTAKFEPYGWYISTGNYTEDMEKVIAPKLQAFEEKKRAAILTMLLCGLGVLALCIFIAFRVASQISRPLQRITNRLNTLSQGDLTSPVPQFTGENETAMLSRAAGTTVSALQGIISDIRENMERMARGDFQIELTHDYPGDTQPIRHSMKVISSSLSSTMSRIGEGSVQVSEGADQVSEGAQTLSQGATEQAASVEELSASIQEISQQVQQNAENAQNADSLTSGMGQKIESSSGEMQQMMAAMTEIKDSSSKIGKIIKAVEEIAFQTNILALNAAVEAAHAGSAGSGFAVVADEVRSLAGKSAKAAKDTAALIESSAASVEKGTQIADSAAKSMKAVVGDAQKVVDLVKQISGSSQEQATSIEQINQGVEQISSVVQNNSATAEESAASSEQLRQQAAVLQKLVGSFHCAQQENEEEETYEESSIQSDGENYAESPSGFCAAARTN